MLVPAPVWIDGAEIERLLSPDQARRLIEAALLDGLDPALDPPRTAPPAGRGHLLVMPSATERTVGVKIASVAPDNPQLGLPRIQAWYVVLDAETLTPTTLMDGTALTSLRTPAVSAVAIDRLAPDEVEHLVMIGCGPQAHAHATAIRQIRRAGRATVIGRDPARIAALVEHLVSLGWDARALAGDSSAAAIRDAELIVCATSAGTPVLDGASVSNGACVVAVGSHERDRRELDSDLMARSFVVVEDVDTALREAGDIAIAVAEGVLDPDSLSTLNELVAGSVSRREDRPQVFKSVGMSWEDVVVAEGVVSAYSAASAWSSRRGS